MKAVITVIGRDSVGILAKVSADGLHIDIWIREL